MNQKEWSDLTPMGGEESPDARLQRAQEELLMQWGEKGKVQKTNFLPYITFLLAFLLTLSLIWNLSIQRRVSRRVEPKKEFGVEKEIKPKGEIGKAGHEGERSFVMGSHQPMERKPEPSQPSEIQKPQKEVSPIVPFPIPTFEPPKPAPPSKKVPTSIPEQHPSPLQEVLRPNLSSPSIQIQPSLPSLPENIQVVGLVITEKTKLAVLRVGGKTVTVSVGEIVPGTGWLVSGIEVDSVQLVFKDEPKRKLVLRPSF